MVTIKETGSADERFKFKAQCDQCMTTTYKRFYYLAELWAENHEASHHS